MLSEEKRKTAQRIPHLQLLYLSELIASRIGLHFSEKQFSSLEYGLHSAAGELGFEDTGSFIEWLMKTPLTRKEVETLAGYLTIGETYFFRQKDFFNFLERDFIPGLIHTRTKRRQKSLRIWSAGCATGEEPYSIAILLKRMLPDIKDWNITILATDINPVFLQKASRGIYKEWSFRYTPSWVKEGYFNKKGDGCLEILPDIKKMVTFTSLNLCEPSYPSILNNTNAMDLIICQNVLMYFVPETITGVIERFHRSLVPGGLFKIAPGEAFSELASRFNPIIARNLILYKKDDTISEREKKVKKAVSSNLERKRQIGHKKMEVAEEEIIDTQETLYEEALQLYSDRHYEDASERLLKLISGIEKKERGFPFVNALILLSRTYANQGRLSDALKWCERAIEAEKMNPAHHYLRAIILQEMGNVREALSALRKTLYLDSDFVLAHLAIGTIMQKQEKPEEAKRYLDNARKILSAYSPEDELVGSEGMTAGRVTEVIRAISESP